MNYRLVNAVMALVITALPVTLFVAAESANAYVWSQWSAYRFAPATAQECAWATTKIVWPATQAQLEVGCRTAVRFRTARVANAPWVMDKAEIESAGPFRTFGMSNIVSFRWNGKAVFTDGSQVCRTWGFGFEVDERWCGTWNDGGAAWGYLEYGVDYKVNLLFKGIPLSATHWARQQLYINGTRSGALGG